MPMTVKGKIVEKPTQDGEIKPRVVTSPQKPSSDRSVDFVKAKKGDTEKRERRRMDGSSTVDVDKNTDTDTSCDGNGNGPQHRYNQLWMVK